MATFNYQNSNQSNTQLPSNFFDYQKSRQPQTGVTQTNPNGGTTSTKPATQWQTYKPQASSSIPTGGVSRPDGRPTPGEQSAPAQSSAPAQASTPPPPTRTAVNVRDYPNVDFNKLNVGDPVAGSPGATWNHNGQGWEIVSQGQGSTGTNGTNTEALPVGGSWTQNLGDYNPLDFSGIQSPIYNPNQYNVNGPQDYADYQRFNYNTQIPTQGYQAGQISQFAGPDQAAMEGGVNSLFQHLLNNPTSMTDAGVAAMKEREKEQILQSQRAFGQQNAELMAQRGMVGGGQDMAQQAALQNQAQKDLLGSYRDIDLQKMQQDFADKQSIATLGNALLTGQMGRATDAYNATLAGQGLRESAAQAQDASQQNLAKLGLSKEELQAAENKNVFDAASQKYNDQIKNIGLQLDAQKLNQAENFKGYDSQAQAVQDRLKAMGLQGAENQFGYSAGQGNASTLGGYAQSDATRALQQLLAEKGFGVDYAKIAQNTDLAKMDDATKRYGINMDFINSMLNRDQSGNQFNQTMAFNTKGQENSFFQWLMGQGLV